MRTLALAWSLGLACTLAVRPADAGAVRMKPGESLLTVYTSPGEGEQPEEDDEFFDGSNDSSHLDLESRARRTGLAVVRECRTIPLPAGVSEYRYTDVSALLDATTTRFTDLTDPEGTRVLEQNFLFDLVSGSALLQRFIDKPVDFYDADQRRHSGVLLAVDSVAHGSWDEEWTNSLILRTKGDAVEMISYGGGKAHSFRFAELPKGFVTKPTLVWQVEAQKAGDHDVVVSYQTGGLAWRSDYTAVVNADDTKLDLSGWVTLANVSGARYPNARLKLIAGDVRRVSPVARKKRLSTSSGWSNDEEEKKKPAVEEKAFFEYHLYTLLRPTTVENNQTKQVEFLKAEAAPATKVYTYDGAILNDNWWWWWRDYDRRDETYGTRSRKTVRVNLEFMNTKAANLGIALPAGIVRVFKRDEADDSLEFIGEDKIAHTPRDERVRLYIGDAFDIVGERVRKTYERPEDYQIRESFEIELRNHKDTAVTIHTLEHLYRWMNWKIEKSSLPFKQLDSQSVEFAVPVPANGKTTLTYTVLYSWPPPTVRIEHVEKEEE